MAIETRVHNLWNNLIESASHATGSLLIWDTGEYEVLPYREPVKARNTDDELSDVDLDVEGTTETHSEKLFAGFQERKLRLRLKGTRLPKGYTISLRLPSANDRKSQPSKPRRKRRRVDPSKVAPPQSTDSENESGSGNTNTPGSEAVPSDTNDATNEQIEDTALASEAEDEDDTIRSNNAYTGATNTIGSVHQRHWFLSLDRKNSGFCRVRSGPDEGRWAGESESFVVLGREVERSVVSGRSADEVMEDEGVKKFIGRKMWRPITE